MINLPLKLSINERDHQTDKVKNLQAIAEALGDAGDADEWTVDVKDPEAFNDALAAASAARKDKLFKICYADMLEGLQSNIEKLAKDDVIRDGLSEALHKKTIVFQWEKEPEWLGSRPSTFQNAEIRDGVLVITCAGPKAAYNTYKVGDNLIEELSDATRLAQNEHTMLDEKTQNLTAIATALGLETPWTVEVKEPLRFNQALPERHRYKLYTVCHKDILGGLKDNVVKLAKDDLVKDALSGQVGTVVIQHTDEEKPAWLKSLTSPHDVRLDDGALIITCIGARAHVNSHTVGRNLLDML